MSINFVSWNSSKKLTKMHKSGSCLSNLGSLINKNFHNISYDLHNQQSVTGKRTFFVQSYLVHAFRSNQWVFCKFKATRSISVNMWIWHRCRHAFLCFRSNNRVARCLKINLKSKIYKSDLKSGKSWSTSCISCALSLYVTRIYR